jgi:lipopolysaccharide/colanic/teichoic acid biosynthesis glycosyltransferase
MGRLTKLFGAWFSSPAPADPVDLLHSVERMRAILHRERQRADRGKSSFALLALTFPARCDEEQAAALGRVLRDRIRVTDDAGWIAARRLGVILPETPVEGAWKLAADLRELLPAGLARPECDVYAYPSSPADGEPVDDRHEHSHNGRALVANGKAATNGKHEANGNGKHAPAKERREARPMHAFFVQPLPMWKRAIDVALAGSALILGAPLFAAVAAAIKLTSRGPVFFAQQRDGLGGRRFDIYKFRTMLVGADGMKAQLRAQSEQDGPAFKLKNDPRVTRLGRLLRRTCIDELPQLWNVLKGDMSIVGPRPMCSKEAAHCAQWQRKRLDVTPGLTCIWQVYGGTKVPFVEWMRMDLRYVRARSLWKDLRLMAMTVPAVIHRDGVY